jgi:DNA polymerase-3 subunit delta
MKIPNYKIDNFCSNFNDPTPAILIYGQDYGLKEERSNLIIKNYLNISNSVIDFNLKSIIANPEILEIELNSMSLLSSKKVVRIRDANDKLTSIIENSILENNNECLLVLLCDNLSPRSKLRLHFERHKNAIILPCYSDDNKSILSIIDEMFDKENIKIDSNAKKLLANYLGIDRLVTKTEIEKAILYSGKEKKLSLEDVSSFLSDQASINIDLLYDFILIGDLKKAYKTLIKLQNEGVPAIQILRSFIRQLQNLYLIKENSLGKNNIDFVIESFKPPIYFKRKANIKLHAKAWSLNMIKKALNLIESAEINSKSFKSNPNDITRHAILNLGMLLEQKKINF